MVLAHSTKFKYPQKGRVKFKYYKTNSRHEIVTAYPTSNTSMYLTYTVTHFFLFVVLEVNLNVYMTPIPFSSGNGGA